tara:strand:+ start:365 stop:1078 length:714 start_codon:yes stop_codon:yes gene_type:complete
MMGIGGGGGPDDLRDPRRYYRAVDDFDRGVHASGYLGELEWKFGAVSGGGSCALISPTSAQTEARGVVKLATDTSSGSSFYMCQRQYVARYFPVGARMGLRMYPDSDSDENWYAGLLSQNNFVGTEPFVAGNTRFLGVRVESSGNVFGVVKSANLAGNEDTVDLGAPAVDTWRNYEWERTAAGIQFFVDGVATGAPVATTHLFNANTWGRALGVKTDAAAAKAIYVDWWEELHRVTR